MAFSLSMSSHYTLIYLSNKDSSKYNDIVITKEHTDIHNSYPAYNYASEENDG